MNGCRRISSSSASRRCRQHARQAGRAWSAGLTRRRIRKQTTALSFLVLFFLCVNAFFFAERHLRNASLACVSCDRTDEATPAADRRAACRRRRLWLSACGARAPGRRTPERLGRPTSSSSPSTPCAPTVWAATATRRPTRPTLDGLAARGARFETAVAQAPLTAPSHASMLTGLTPLGHGVRDNGGLRAAARRPHAGRGLPAGRLPHGRLRLGFPLKRRFGFDRGFDSYDDHLPRGKDARRTAYVERTADRTTDAALAWLRPPSRGDGPFFLWVHYYDPHAPYEAPAEAIGRARRLALRRRDRLRRRAARAPAARLDERRAAARTLVLVTADHGESLGEHGEDTHGIFVYDANARGAVDPGRSRSLRRAAWLRPSPAAIDVAPTLLDYAGLAPRDDGRTLAAPRRGGRALADAPAYAESLHPQLQYGWAPLHALRTASYKLIEAPRPSSTTSSRCRRARRTARRGSPRASRRCARELQRAMATTRRTPNRPMDPRHAERLAALGYVGGAGGAAPGPTGRDPKDGIRLPRASAATA